MESQKPLLDKIIDKAQDIGRLRNVVRDTHAFVEKATIDLARYRGDLATEEADLWRLVAARGIEL